MKRLPYFIAVIAFGLLFASCESDISEPQMSSNPTAAALDSLSYSGQFTMAYADSSITFSWSAADFGFQSSTTYIVQLCDTIDFSRSVANLISTQKMSGSTKVSDINTLILSWNHPIGTPVTVYYRVAASVTGSVDPAYSSVRTKVFVPYDAVINYPMVYVPGAYQGWSPGAADGRLYSYGFNTQYSSIVRLIDTSTTSTQFKITSDPDWNHTNWGGALTASGNNYSGTLDPTGANFQVNNACYVVSVDVTALTISLTKTDDWGIIGSGVPTSGWSSDVNMSYNGQRKMWEITADFLAGEVKFRANDDWTLNYGDNGADGSLESGGSNIALATAGNYTIRFDPVALTYTVKKN